MLDLAEQVVDKRLETRQRGVSRKAVTDAQLGASLTGHDSHPTSPGHEDPDHLDPMPEVPGGLVQLQLRRLVLAGNLDGEHRRNASATVSCCSSPEGGM